MSAAETSAVPVCRCGVPAVVAVRYVVVTLAGPLEHYVAACGPCSTAVHPDAPRVPLVEVDWPAAGRV